MASVSSTLSRLYPPGTSIRVKRVSSDRPGNLAPDWSGHGTLAAPIKRGGRLAMYHTGSNPSKLALRLFTTSQILMISANDDGSLGVKTENSVYRVSLVVDTP